MLELVIGIALGMVLAWNVFKEQPQFIADLWDRVKARING